MPYRFKYIKRLVVELRFDKPLDAPTPRHTIDDIQLYVTDTKVKESEVVTPTEFKVLEVEVAEHEL